MKSALPGRETASCNRVFNDNQRRGSSILRALPSQISTPNHIINTSSPFQHNHCPKSDFTLPLPRRSTPSKRLFSLALQ